jgi:pimeloyl-ACP methyl ester carboxylesterase
MILYISGLNSTYKPYIPAALSAVFDQPTEYYVIQNVISADLARLQDIIAPHREVVVIGHSTGAFLALNLHRLHPKVRSVVMINPAIDLLYSLDKNNPDHPILNERSLIEEFIRANEQFYFDGQQHPVYCLQGRLDDRVDVAYNAHFVQSAQGEMTFLEHLGHRFDEQEFGDLLGHVKNAEWML